MKNVYLFLGLIGSICLSYAQVAIGKENVTNSSVILEFADNTTNGINLPILTTIPTASASLNGAIMVDANDAKVKWCENGNWEDISDAGSVSSITLNSSPSTGEGVLIGAQSNPIGVLELRANNKAMVLPKIASPHLSVKSPVTGMICYDTTSKSLAVFDGIKWNYWN